MWGWNWLENFLQDVRYGMRMLSKNRGFTVVAVLTLALGIGANTAIFSVVEAVLIRPLPYPEPGRLIWISRVLPALHARLVASTDYIAWLEQNKTLTGISALDESGTYNLTGHGVAQRVPGAAVSSNFFSTLGVQPFLGRAFTPGEDRPGGHPVVLLTHSFWRRHFNGDRNVLGQTLTLDNQIYTIVGVMPESFRFPQNPKVELIAPLVIDPSPPAPGELRIQLLHVIARLKSRVTIAQASAEIETISQRLHPDDSTGAAPAQGPGGRNSTPGGPATETRTTTAAPQPGPGARPPAGQPATNPPARMFNPFEHGQMEVVPLHRELVGDVRPALLILLAAVALVLLIACANVANLMLARASARMKEISVRAALGASRLRLLRQLLTESVVLGCAGGLLGLLLAYGGVHLITAYTPAKVAGNIFQLVTIGINSSVLLYALAVSVLTGVVFGLAPALADSKPELNQALKESGQALAFSLRRNLLRSALVATEISLSLVLLIGAGLLMKSFYQLWAVDPGFRPDHVLAFAVELNDSKYSKDTQQAAFFQQLFDRLRVLPGVKAAGLCNSLPLSRSQRVMSGIQFEGQPARPPEQVQSQSASSISVSADYFRTMGIPIIQGRGFTEHDDAGAPKVVILNQTMAHQFFPNENAIGRRMVMGQGANALASVVGVVGDVKNRGLDAQAQPAFFVPFSQSPDSTMEVALLTAVEPTSMTTAVRNAVAGIDPEQPVFDISTMDERLAASVAPRRFNLVLLASFALLAMLLASVGIYGVVSYSVSQRTHEVGVRMALGAQRRDVLKVIVAQGMVLLLIGIGVGLIGAFLLTRFLAALLYGVRPTDSATFAAVSLLLAVVAIVACYIPARRAAGVDPMVALRYE
jgi:putative ABC transport system permease protein